MLGKVQGHPLETWFSHCGLNERAQRYVGALELGQCGGLLSAGQSSRNVV